MPPPIPETLGDAGRDLWTRAWQASAWISPDLDATAVEQACHLVDEIADMRAKVAEQGLTSLKPVVSGGEVIGAERRAHPLIREIRGAERQLRAWLAALGFDPTSRSALGVAEEKIDDLDELRSKREKRRAGLTGSAGT